MCCGSNKPAGAAPDPAPAEELGRVLRRAGAGLVGFADLRAVRSRPFPELETGVAVARPFCPDPGLARDPGPEKANPAYVEAYLENRLKIDPLVMAGVEFLRQAGYRALGYGYECFFGRRGGDMNPEAYLTAHYQHKTTARLAGLGWIGRMGVLVTPELGPLVWLGTILTDAPLPPAGPAPNRCGQCRRCVEACPAGAVAGPAWEEGFSREDVVDIKKCQAHRRLRGRDAKVPMCGLCLAACPFGTRNSG